MIAVTLLVVADVLGRWLGYADATSTPSWIVALSVIAAVLVSLGATLGGGPVYDSGFNVETAGDSPVWHSQRSRPAPRPRAVAAERI